MVREREDHVKLAKSKEVFHVLGGLGRWRLGLVFLRRKDQGPVEDQSAK